MAVKSHVLNWFSNWGFFWKNCSSFVANPTFAFFIQSRTGCLNLSGIKSESQTHGSPTILFIPSGLVTVSITHAGVVSVTIFCPIGHTRAFADSNHSFATPPMSWFIKAPGLNQFSKSVFISAGFVLLGEKKFTGACVGTGAVDHAPIVGLGVCFSFHIKAEAHCWAGVSGSFLPPKKSTIVSTNPIALLQFI